MKEYIQISRVTTNSVQSMIRLNASHLIKKKDITWIRPKKKFYVSCCTPAPKYFITISDHLRRNYILYFFLTKWHKSRVSTIFLSQVMRLRSLMLVLVSLCFTKMAVTPLIIGHFYPNFAQRKWKVSTRQIKDKK